MSYVILRNIAWTFVSLHAIDAGVATGTVSRRWRGRAAGDDAGGEGRGPALPRPPRPRVRCPDDAAGDDAGGRATRAASPSSASLSRSLSLSLSLI